MPCMQLPTFVPALRIAILQADLTLPQIRKRFRKSRAVASEAPLLCELACAIEASTIGLPQIEAAVIVFTGAGRADLTDLERDLFWRVFQVPVFEHLLTPDGQILAMECDAHDGLHLLDPGKPPDVLPTRLDATPCGCGNPNARLVRIERWESLNAAPMIFTPAKSSHVYNYSENEQHEVGAAGRVA